MIVLISIGNSDDKLTQKEWSAYWHAVDYRLGWSDVNRIFGVWHSNPVSMYQNACWQIEVLDPEELKLNLAILAKAYRQDSIAWTECKETEFLG